jgi:type I restriction enzyme S subunit
MTPIQAAGGVDWIGTIPSHWSLIAVKRVAMLKSGDTISADSVVSDGTYPVYGGNGFRGYTDRFTHEGNYLLIGRQGALCGNINYASGQFWASEHAIVVTLTKTVSQGWLGYVLMAMDLNRYSLSAAQPGLSVETIKNLLIPLPPPAEQRAIADFLDRETAKIDALIATQERLIALLDEKRQATITQAITKGLDPTAPMKDSGVEWLGPVPANWGVLPLKRCCRIPNGLVDPAVGRYATLSLIAPNHIQSGTGRLLEVETADDQGAISGKYHFAEGTVLYSKIRPALRKACVAPFEGLCSADMYPIYSTKIMPRLLLYQLLSDWFSNFAILASDRVAMPKVNRETIGDFLMVVPPSAEQEVIVRYVDEAVAEINRLRDRSVEVIERLRERRAALITAAVTGQIDVSRPAITEAAE